MASNPARNNPIPERIRAFLPVLSSENHTEKFEKNFEMPSKFFSPYYLLPMDIALVIMLFVALMEATFAS